MEKSTGKVGTMILNEEIQTVNSNKPLPLICVDKS